AADRPDARGDGGVVFAAEHGGGEQANILGGVLGARPVPLDKQCSSLGHMSSPCVTPGEKHRPLVVGRAELDIGFTRVEGKPSALRQRHMDGGGALKERGAGPPVELDEFTGGELPTVGDTLATDADTRLGARADDGSTPARRWGVAGVLDA